ncbi:MAG: oligosaccharide flippase family protein [Oscillospiraceae bacterium]|nr:oligosaccharide flippase family protein [Oscillospiraceae bacterium]
MYRVRKMLLNTALLTAAAFLMRSVGMAFQVYLSKMIGAAGIGLYSLIMSVSALAATVALSGIRFTATRLVAMELGRGSRDGVRAVMRKCLIYALTCGAAAAAALWFGADVIGERWIGDARTVLPLRVLSLSLPAFSLTAVLSGYFTAVGHIIKPTVSQAVEQVVRIAAAVFALKVYGVENLSVSCSIIVAGGVIGELASFFIHLVMYLREGRGAAPDAGEHAGLTRRILVTAVPLALSAYARVALTTVQNLLIPRGLRKHGASSETALAGYGMIQGMVFPVITFPSAIFYSLAELLVPELTDAQVQGDDARISALVNNTLRFAMLFALCAAAVLFRFSDELGRALYGSADAGRLIRSLAPLVPVMYLDSVTDGMLRGLGQQMHSMRYNVLDSLISLALVYYLLPIYAVRGYIFMIYFTDLFNFALSIRRLALVARVRVTAADALKSLFCALGAVDVAMLLLRTCGLPLAAGGASVTLHIIMSAAVYAALLFALGSMTRRDLDRFRALFTS